MPPRRRPSPSNYHDFEELGDDFHWEGSRSCHPSEFTTSIQRFSGSDNRTRAPTAPSTGLVDRNNRIRDWDDGYQGPDSNNWGHMDYGLDPYPDYGDDFWDPANVRFGSRFGGIDQIYVHDEMGGRWEDLPPMDLPYIPPEFEWPPWDGRFVGSRPKNRRGRPKDRRPSGGMIIGYRDIRPRKHNLDT